MRWSVLSGISPPSANRAMPAALGAMTHSAPSTKPRSNQRTASQGFTPAMSSIVPRTMSRSMWCA